MSGYKGISDLTIPLQDGTLLIGKNNIGKSNIVRSIFALREIIDQSPDSLPQNPVRSDILKLYDAAERHSGMDEDGPSASRSVETISCSEWVEKHSMDDGPTTISFKLLVNLGAEGISASAYEDVIEDLDIVPFNREAIYDYDAFRNIEYELSLNESGIQKEIFRGNVENENVIISERTQNDENKYYQLAFDRINAEDVDVALPQLPGDSFGGTPPSDRECNLWYSTEDPNSLVIGQIIPEPFKQRFLKILRSCTRLGAFRIPRTRVPSDATDALETGYPRQLSSVAANLFEFFRYLDDRDTDYDFDLKDISDVYRNAIEEALAIGTRREQDEIVGLVDEEQGDTFASSQISSGSLEALSLITTVLNAEELESHLLAIEEPELHLHPDTERIMIELFESSIEEGLQVLITSHSSTFIDYFKTNSLLVAQRSTEHMTTVDEITRSELEPIISWSTTPLSSILQSEGIILVSTQRDRELLEKLDREQNIGLRNSGCTITVVDTECDDSDLDTVLNILDSLNILYGQFGLERDFDLSELDSTEIKIGGQLPPETQDVTSGNWEGIIDELERLI